MQRRYYEDQGVEAFRANVVPNYITNNPYIAQSYARVVLGYLRDCFSMLDHSQPVYLLELGAGVGRFAFHFMRVFTGLLAQSPFPDLNFCYILSDLPEQNLAFWQEHPALQEWVAAGKLDFARFDARSDSQIRLHHARRSLAPGEIKNPLVVLANYFFDSLPQDAFHVENGRLQECRIELASVQAEPDPTAAGVLPRIKIFFKTQEGDTVDYYNDPDLDSILPQYRVLENSYLLFPLDAIRLLRGFKRLSGGRMLLLAGDFGPVTVQDWDHNGAPDIRIHGSISMEVNFHALGAFVENQGGRFFVPGFRGEFLTVCAFLLDDTPARFSELALAYRHSIEENGPNDFFLIKRGMEKNYAALSLKELLAYLRFSGWDAHLFLDSFPFLLEKIQSAGARDRQELESAVIQLWDNYFHLGEERDLPFNIGVVLFRLNNPRSALVFFEISLRQYGPSPLTLYNIALCLTQVRRYRHAWARVKQALLLDREFEPARQLAEELKKHRVRLMDY